MEMLGDTLDDRYRLEERLRGGELLSTYRAVDTVLGIEVDIDVVAGGVDGCTVPAQRVREILDAAILVSGANISPLHAWGEEKETGCLYLVREKMAGASLAEVLSGTGELPIEQVAEITRAAVDVLSEAYGKDLFYLGLNPNQVYLDVNGGVKFTRVGFGWILEDGEPGLAARVSPYRAPETDGGKEGSRTSDVFSLAAMVREMLPRGAGSDRLRNLLRTAMDPLPKRRPSSPRLLLEELEEGRFSVGRMDPPDGENKTARAAEGAGGLGFLARTDSASQYINLSQRPRRRILRNLLLVVVSGLALWLVFAAVAGSISGGGDGGEEPLSTLAEERITLPDLQGFTADEAGEILAELGLEFSSREAPSRLWSAGRVAAQEPAEGSILSPGDTVCLVISSGREDSGVEDSPGDAENPASSSGQPPDQAPAVESAPNAALSPPPASPVLSPPVAANTAPRAMLMLSSRGGPAPLYVAMDGSRSYDPDGAVVRYVWHCGDGTVLEGVYAQHVYDPEVIPACYQVVLEVFDAAGSSDTSAVTVEVY
jgi:hypothetical protein